MTERLAAVDDIANLRAVLGQQHSGSSELTNPSPADLYIQGLHAEWTDKPHMLTPGVAISALREVANLVRQERGEQ